MQEIERKFLIDKEKFLDAHRPLQLQNNVYIAQGYLSTDPERTVRVRVMGNTGWITVKGKSSEDGLTRFEWETEINVNDAKDMLGMCTSVISKLRYYIGYDGKTWEIDAFDDENSGLIVAEIELQSETETITIPSWVTVEVTGDPKYYNSALTKHPYKDW
ncbi:CYTH domain-containing protein [Pseudomonas phage Astolliot]|nr:CYTH domain-containing protein [Pseudomonas phage Astolliot]